MDIIRHSDELLEIKIPKNNYDIIWISDLHADSDVSIWNKVKKYLIDNPNSYIVIGGDSIDVMQFVRDKRASRSSTKDGLNEDDYANRVIEYVRNEIVLPFKDRIISWNRGNHDNSIIRHHNIDLLQLICGVDIPLHEYSGYILLSNHVYKNRTYNNLIHFSHSPEFGGKRSKGSLSIDIAKSQYPSANIWIREHIHDGFIHPVRHEFVACDKKTVYNKDKWYIQNIAAKQEHTGKRNGFHFEKNMNNRASGFVVMEFRLDKDKARTKLNKAWHYLL